MIGHVCDLNIRLVRYSDPTVVWIFFKPTCLLLNEKIWLCDELGAEVVFQNKNGWQAKNEQNKKKDGSDKNKTKISL